MNINIGDRFKFIFQNYRHSTDKFSLGKVYSIDSFVFEDKSIVNIIDDRGVGVLWGGLCFSTRIK